MASRKPAKKKAKKKVAKRKPGRPTKYTKALATRLCTQLTHGKSLRTVCKMDSMPGATTVFRWLGSNDLFREQYEKALSERTDTLVEDMLDISDNMSLHPQDKRVMIDTRKWIASKLKPKRYGDKLEIGSDPDKPLITKIQRELV